MTEFIMKETPEKQCEKCGKQIYIDEEVLLTAKYTYRYICPECGCVYHSHTKDVTMPSYQLWLQKQLEKIPKEDTFTEGVVGSMFGTFTFGVIFDSSCGIDRRKEYEDYKMRNKKSII